MTIEARDCSVYFGRFRALHGVSLVLPESEIVGVIGPNGSGKSTLFNVITGFVKPSNGQVYVDEVDVTNEPSYSRILNGISRTFQTPRFSPNDTVLETVTCGAYPHARRSLLASLLNTREARRAESGAWATSREILASLGLASLVERELGDLSMGQMRLIDVARAIANGAKYLLLDEPAAGLTEAEQHSFKAVIRRLAEDGKGVLLIEHNYGLVSDVASSLYVLNRGEVMLHDRPEVVAASREFRNLYLGIENASN